jgi:hypothetical protein
MTPSKTSKRKTSKSVQRTKGIPTHRIAKPQRTPSIKSGISTGRKKQAPKGRKVASTGHKGPADTKQAKVLALLRRPAGATIQQLIDASGWQAHSVRGFLSAVVRKKLKLDLGSEQQGDKRVYRIASGKTAAACLSRGGGR